MGRIEDEQRHVQQTSDLHLATIEALARAIDAKDQTTQTHIRRVQIYAAGLAKAVGLSADEIQGVKTAALLHDIGKLAVPEHILSKPGPLTQEEFQKIRIHPQVGAEIIAAVPFPYPVAPLILSHHERWDGKGYPQGLGRRGHSDRRAHPDDRRLLRRRHDRAAVSQGAQPRERRRPAASTRPGRALDPDARRDVRRACCPALVAERDAEASPAERADRRRSPTATRLDGRRARADRARAERVREHRARAPRDLRALRDRAVDGHQPRRRRTRWRSSRRSSTKIIPWSGCALFLQQTGRQTC